MDVVTLDDTGSSCSPNQNNTESDYSPNKDDSVTSCSPTKNFAENSFSPRKDDPTDEDYVEIIRDPCHGDQEPFVPPTKRGDAPLAGILKSDIEDIDPRRYFPDYKPNETLRFSRVFAANSKPTLRNQIWWTSKTFNKNSQKSKSIAAVQETDAPADEVISGLDQNWKLKIGRAPKPEECVTDDYQLLCTPEDAAPWRFGPAQIWYDRMGVPANPKKFNYGFGLKKKTSSAIDPKAAETDLPAVGEESTFLPVDLLHWEDDIIIDAEEARKKIVADFSDNKLPRCGWIPTAQTRTYKAFISAFNQGAFQQMFSQPGIFPRQLVNNEADLSKVTIDANHSLFPMDNYEFETTRWEDNIIWDSENMPSIPEPRMLTLDYEDDPTIFGMPDDGCTEDKDGQSGSKQPFRQENQLSRKAEMIIMQTPNKLRQHHRTPLSKQVMRHFLGKTTNIFSLTRHIRKIDEQRERQKLSEGGVDIFLMREVQDLTARDGTLVMLEYVKNIRLF
uniref:Uncharacterized protein n=1 Tax=Ditylenchus dipsaci TaxID=166011 RepID=A0A915DXT9_9BILA